MAGIVGLLRNEVQRGRRGSGVTALSLRNEACPVLGEGVQGGLREGVCLCGFCPKVHSQASGDRLGPSGCKEEVAPRGRASRAPLSHSSLPPTQRPSGSSAAPLVSAELTLTPLRPLPQPDLADPKLEPREGFLQDPVGRQGTQLLSFRGVSISWGAVWGPQA